MNYLKKLLGLCEHKWEIIKEDNILSQNESDVAIGRYYILQCKNCGNIKCKKNEM